ncbi:uncharacterized protein [Montipora capricornis]|uniref:uncharacterized protein n=1 Tax=Montipora capricornis TaxID=246305 RepID=UPI0035F1B20F
MDDSTETGERVTALEEIFKTASKKSVDVLDLKKKKLEYIPNGLLLLSPLRYLYLEGNIILSLPEEFFHCLGNLEWLDLRNNKLSEIPGNVGKHKNLKTLLLGRNQLRFLPPEIGFVKTLTGLNLSENPLQDPPLAVITKGVYAIKAYLLGKLGHCTEDLNSEDIESDYSESTKSEDEFTEGANNMLKDRNSDTETNLGDSERDSCLPASNNHKEVDHQYVASMSGGDRVAMSHYGGLLGEIPNSYIFKPWKTGVFFKREATSDKLSIGK